MEAFTNINKFYFTCCCCYDEPVKQLPIWGDKDDPKRWGIPPDSESRGIRLSLVIVDSHLLTGAPLKGSCHCPQLSSWSRFSDSVVGFTGQKTQPTASKYGRKYIKVLKYTSVTTLAVHLLQVNST